MTQLLAFSGSLREQSLNHRLITVVSQRAAQQGAQVKLCRLNDFEIPMYNQDIEDQAFPEGVLRWRQDMQAADGFLIASPEYNGFFSGPLKNAIDWASRPHADDPPLVCFKNKVAGLFAASPGGLGGMRGLPRLATLLRGIGTLVEATQCTVGGAHEVLADITNIDDETLAKIDAVIAAVLKHC